MLSNFLRPQISSLVGLKRAQIRETIDSWGNVTYHYKNFSSRNLVAINRVILAEVQQELQHAA